jgi:phytanoyl-CoA hydroxylase
MLLTDQQVEEFHTNGFILLKQFADPKRCDDIRKLATNHLYEMVEPIESEEEYQQRRSGTKTTRRLRQVYDREPLFKAWMRDPEMYPILEQLLGETPVLLLAHHNSIMTKLPHISSVTTWHQDIRYWHFENDNLLSVWLSLGNEYLENGLLEFIPGSHKMKFRADQFDVNAGFRDDLPENKTIIANRVHYELNKGDVVLFHAKTLHYANKNVSDEPKISFVYSLRGISNKPISGTRSDAKEIVL